MVNDHSAGSSVSGVPNQVQCDLNTAVVGQKVRSLKSPNHLLDDFLFVCAPVSNTNARTPERGFRSGGDPGSIESEWTYCPEGELAVGIHGSAGLFIDKIGLSCYGLVQLDPNEYPHGYVELERGPSNALSVAREIHKKTQAGAAVTRSDVSAARDPRVMGGVTRSMPEAPAAAAPENATLPDVQAHRCSQNSARRNACQSTPQ
jgi:hypothetical protein